MSLVGRLEVMHNWQVDDKMKALLLLAVCAGRRWNRFQTCSRGWPDSHHHHGHHLAAKRVSRPRAVPNVTVAVYTWSDAALICVSNGGTCSPTSTPNRNHGLPSDKSTPSPSPRPPRIASTPLRQVLALPARPRVQMAPQSGHRPALVSDQGCFLGGDL